MAKKKLSDVTVLLTKAKRRAAGIMPYLGCLLYSMRTIVTSNVQTAAVDKYGRLYVNPEWIVTLKVKQVAYVLLHEVLHCALSHAKRREMTVPNPTPKDAETWNIAADLCIQQILARQITEWEPKSGIKIDNWLHVPGLKPNMSTEAYYALLREKQKQDDAPYRSDNWLPDFEDDEDDEEGFGTPVFSEESDEDGEADGDGEGDGESQDEGEGESDSDSSTDSMVGTTVKGDTKSGGGSSKGQTSGGDSQSESDESSTEPCDPSNCGSSSDGIPREYEEPVGMADALAQDSKLLEVEAAIEECERAGIGNVPGELRQSLKVRLHPQPDPFEKLRQCVSRSVASPLGDDEYTYRKAYRKQQADMPVMKGVTRLMPEAVVIVDTSGSMECGECKAKAINAVARGLRRVQNPRVVCYDHGWQSNKRISSISKFDWVGGGGTDMAAAITEADAKYQPDAIVLITDGETYYPTVKPNARVIIGLVSARSRNYPTPKWAKVVKCYEEAQTYGG